MKMRMLALFLMLMTTAISSWADTLDFALSNDSVQAQLMGAFANKQLGYDLSGFHNETRGDVVAVGVHVNDRIKASTGALTTAIGGKAVAFNVDGGPDGSAFAIGGYLRQNFSAANLVSLRGDVYYAPRVVSWGGADHYLELGVRLEYQLVEQAAVYVGFRKIEASFDNNLDRTLDESAHLGLILSF